MRLKETTHGVVSSINVGNMILNIFPESVDANQEAQGTSQKVPVLVAVMLIVPIVCVLIILAGFKIYSYSK